MYSILFLSFVCFVRVAPTLAKVIHVNGLLLLQFGATLTIIATGSIVNVTSCYIDNMLPMHLHIIVNMRADVAAYFTMIYTNAFLQLPPSALHASGRDTETFICKMQHMTLNSKEETYTLFHVTTFRKYFLTLPL